MKKRILILAAALLVQLNFVQAQDSDWKMVEGKTASPWAEQVNPEKPLPEYPRPQMVRENWQNLNSLWNFTVQPKAQQETIPTSFNGQILVPFAIESALSGVGQRVGKDSVLWYKRKIKIPSKLRKQNVLLHFGAVEQASLSDTQESVNLACLAAQKYES